MKHLCNIYHKKALNVTKIVQEKVSKDNDFLENIAKSAFDYHYSLIGIIKVDINGDILHAVYKDERDKRDKLNSKERRLLKSDTQYSTVSYYLPEYKKSVLEILFEQEKTFYILIINLENFFKELEFFITQRG